MTLFSLHSLKNQKEQKNYYYMHRQSKANLTNMYRLWTSNMSFVWHSKGPRALVICNALMNLVKIVCKMVGIATTLHGLALHTFHFLLIETHPKNLGFNANFVVPIPHVLLFVTPKLLRSISIACRTLCIYSSYLSTSTMCPLEFVVDHSAWLANLWLTKCPKLILQ